MTPSQPDRSERLLELAQVRFGDDLTDADRYLFKMVANGEMASYGDGRLPAQDAGPERTISADRIRWLCTDPDAVKQVIPHEGVRLSGAHIGTKLLLSCTSIKFPIILKKCLIADGIELYRAHLFSLNLLGTHTGGVDADGVVVDHDMFMRDGFANQGELRIPRARIGGDLSFRRATLSNPGKTALLAEGAKVAGTVILRQGFKAEGQVSFNGSEIGGNLECDNGSFIYPGVALDCNRVKVAGSVYLRNGFKSDGTIDFTFAEVRAGFHWYGVVEPEGCQLLDLRSATVGTLLDEAESYPKALELDGFVYGRIFRKAPLDAMPRVDDWIRRNDHGQFLPQPYEQLARVFQEMGHPERATAVQIEKQKDTARVKAMTWRQRPVHAVFGATIGYGYRPWRAAWWMASFLVVGTIVFHLSARDGGLELVDAAYAPQFSSLIYSADVFIPLIDLHQAKYRNPREMWTWCYMWIHIIAGWVLSTLLVVGLTGLVRR